MTHRVKSRVAGGVALTIGLSLGCGNNPLSPSSRPPLPDGRYSLYLSGDPLMCGDVKTPSAGTTLNLRLTATHEGNTWIGRASTPEDGNIELRLRYTTQISTLQSGKAVFDNYYVEGTMSGSANDSGRPPGSPPSSRVAAIADRTTIEGIYRPGPKYADGFVLGDTAFSRDGVTSTCPSGIGTWVIELQR